MVISRLLRFTMVIFIIDKHNINKHGDASIMTIMNELIMIDYSGIIPSNDDKLIYGDQIVVMSW